MAFKTESRTLRNIFERSVIYTVPRYQRNYVWNEINWKELWIDITFTLKNEDKISWSHFLGTIVFNKTNKNKNGLEVYEIIDGQQRLVTIYILIISIYKNFKKNPNNREEKMSNYIYSNFITSLTNESKKIQKIYNEYYNEDIQYIIDFSTNGNNILKNNKLSKLFNYFDNKLEDKDTSYLRKIFEKVLSINIVEIISDEDEEIFNIFEVLNARGRKLRQIELLKNHTMKYIQPKGDELVDKAKNKWRDIQGNINHLTDPDILIQHFSKCYIEKNAKNKDSIYRLIKEEVNIEDLSNFLGDLESFSYEYKAVTKKDSKNSVIRYFNIKSNQQVRPLLCAINILYSNGIITAEVREKALLQIRNFFFIFNTIKETSNKTEKKISSYSYKFYHCNYEAQFKMLFSEFMNELEHYILNKDYKKDFINNESFKYSNKNKNLKRNSKLVMFLLELICEKEQKDTNLDCDNLTIEHLSSDDGSLEKSSIWNLTITSEDINSKKLKNKPISEKIKILNENSTIKINQNLNKYIKEGKFDFEKRKKDMISAIFDEIFNFDKLIFNINSEQLEKYMKYCELLKSKNDSELLELLNKEGKNFETKLEKDPKLNSLRIRFNEYKRNPDL